jgi:predicted double-glycine peptidase
VDVPFLAQTVDLCGGAAAAMVLRYWGDEDVQAEDFATLVDSTRGGISTLDLVNALSARGAIARPIRAEPEDVRREIANGRPVIALIDGGAGRLHYVVIVAWAAGRVMYHDPSVGPFQVSVLGEFVARWNATGGFALVVTRAAVPGRPEPSVSTPAPPRIASPCDSLVDPAIEVARGQEPENAVADLLAANQLCPADPRPSAALAGVRFTQKRFKDAAVFARQAAERAPGDPLNWRLLGASLYLSDEPIDALAAWGRIDEPRIDRIEIVGLRRTRADVANEVIGLRPRDLLTRESLAVAERRIDELPSASGGRLIYQPGPGGRADIVASVSENRLLEPWLILGLRLGGELAARREAAFRISSPTGRGEALEIGGRFAARRPSAWMALDTPRLGGLPGVVSLRALWDRQTYRLDGIPRSEASVETRRRGSIDWSHWLTSKSRVTIGFGIDRFKERFTYGSMNGGLEFRLLGDRLAILGNGGVFRGSGDAPGFADAGGAISFRSSVAEKRFTFSARLDGRRASSQSPRALYPGAGKGPGRPFLLRSVRLVDDGELIGEVFGRGLGHGIAEIEVNVAKIDTKFATAHVGVAVFTDWAKPWDTSRGPGAGPSVFAIGAGVRLRVAAVALRVDAAKRPGRSGILVSAGVIPPWPR